MISEPAPKIDLVFPDKLPSPRTSLQTRAVAAVMALVIIPSALCAYLIHRQTSEVMVQGLVRDSQFLAEMTVHMVERFVATADDSALEEAIALIRQDRRVAFIVVTDRQGRVLAHHYNEPLAWHEYVEQLTPRDRTSPVMLNRSIKLDGDDRSVLVVRRQLISQIDGQAPPEAQGAADSEARRPTGRILGYVELALQDPRHAQLLTDVEDSTILMVGLICLLCMPLVIMWVRGWTNPLRKMLAATFRLGLGGELPPLNIKREDEIGLLAQSFNAMATNLSAIQSALIAANEQLEHKVTERTYQLERTNRRLESEMKEKDQFLRAVSHDLGAPLRNIAGLAGMLMLKHRSDVNDEVLSKLERIAANAKAETELLGELMELSRIKSRPGKRQQVDLNELVAHVAEQLSYDLERHQISLDVEPLLPTVYVERSRMRQVFQNLLDNAIKYMPHSAKVRRIKIGWKVLSGERVLYVQDTGAGIEAEDHERIFQVFRRARNSAGGEVEGKGVGLATVRAIVESNGGRIWVDSEPPDGATFYFTIDRRYVVDRDRPEWAAQAAQAEAEAAAIASTSDDDADE